MTAVDVFKEEGRKEGKKEGRKEERFYMLVDMFSIIKSISLSQEVRDYLKEADFETLGLIKESFPKIESEEDLRRLLSK